MGGRDIEQRREPRTESQSPAAASDLLRRPFFEKGGEQAVVAPTLSST
jgi:hypothetical protein